MTNIIKERNERLSGLSDKVQSKRDLLIELKADEKKYTVLIEASKIFLYDCLNEYFKREMFDLNLPIEDFVKKYENYIIELPNITPNGLVLPKKEVLLTYNNMLKAVGELYSNLGLHKTCVAAACPVNLRINFGNRINEDFKNRPKSSTTWHTDIWAGQNSNEVMLHTPIFGDFQKNGILVAVPTKAFFPEFVKPLASFSDGSYAIKDSIDKSYNPKMKIGSSYLLDSFLLHKTLNTDDSFRGIVSFPIKVEKVESDIYQNKERDSEYYESPEWMKFGNEKLIVTDKRLEKLTYKNESSITYADKFDSIDIHKT